MKHNKSTINTNQSQNNTLEIFQSLQPELNKRVKETTQRQTLDVNMFQQTVKLKKEVNENKAASQAQYGQQSKQVFDKNTILQGEINQAFANPFYDLSAFFSGEKSTDDLLNDQKALAGQLRRIHRDNTNTSAIFDSEINTLNEGLKDQLGLTKLRADQGVELERLIDRGTKIESSVKKFEDDALEGFSLKMIELEMRDSGSKFTKGRLIKWQQIKQTEALDLVEKKRKATNGGKQPTREDVLGFTGMDTLKTRMDVMTNLAQDSTIIDGFQFSKSQLAGEIAKKKGVFETSAGSIDSLNQNFALASSVVGVRESDFARLDVTNLPPKNQAEMQASVFLSNTYENAKNEIQLAMSEGKQVTNQQFARINVLARETFGMRQRAVDNAAKIKAERFESKAANTSAIKFYKTGRVESAGDARNIMTELVLTEDPDSIANEVGTVLGPVIKDFASSFSNGMVSNFADTSVKPEDGEFSVEALQTALFEQGKVNKLNSNIAWRRVIGEQVTAETGEESNRWVGQIANQVLSAQLQVGTQAFLNLPEVKDNEQLRNLLITSGGNLKAEFLNADTDSVGSIVQRLAILSAQQKLAGKIPEETDFARMYLDTLQGESILAIAKRELERPNISLQSLIRGLYGSDSKATSSYLGMYTDKLRGYDTVANEKEIRKTVEENEQRRKEQEQLLNTGKEALQLIAPRVF